jgi:hypothetical protein
MTDTQHQLSLLDQIRRAEVELAEQLEREQHPPFVAGSPTSYEAAKEIREDAGTLRELVYVFIRDHGPVSDEQIAEHLCMNPSTARPRRLELYRAGRIHQSGYTRTNAGRRAVAWST